MGMKVILCGIVFTIRDVPRGTFNHLWPTITELQD
jgi:hypothetical protein